MPIFSHPYLLSGVLILIALYAAKKDIPSVRHLSALDLAEVRRYFMAHRLSVLVRALIYSVTVLTCVLTPLYLRNATPAGWVSVWIMLLVGLAAYLMLGRSMHHFLSHYRDKKEVLLVALLGMSAALYLLTLTPSTFSIITAAEVLLFGAASGTAHAVARRLRPAGQPPIDFVLMQAVLVSMSLLSSVVLRAYPFPMLYILFALCALVSLIGTLILYPRRDLD